MSCQRSVLPRIEARSLQQLEEQQVNTASIRVSSSSLYPFVTPTFLVLYLLLSLSTTLTFEVLLVSVLSLLHSLQSW